MKKETTQRIAASIMLLLSVNLACGTAYTALAAQPDASANPSNTPIEKVDREARFIPPPAPPWGPSPPPNIFDWIMRGLQWIAGILTNPPTIPQLRTGVMRTQPPDPRGTAGVRPLKEEEILRENPVRKIHRTAWQLHGIHVSREIERAKRRGEKFIKTEPSLEPDKTYPKRGDFLTDKAVYEIKVTVQGRQNFFEKAKAYQKYARTEKVAVRVIFKGEKPKHAIDTLIYLGFKFVKKHGWWEWKPPGV